MSKSVCIIGCGYISGIHIETYRGYKESIEISLCDTDLERARAIGKQNGIKRCFQGYREVLEQEDIEIIDICLPNFLHEEVAVAALNAGKHVLLEKPIATTLSGAEAIISAAQNTSGKFMVAESDRFVLATARMYELMVDGAIGEVFWVQGNAFGTFKPSGWRISRSMLGGGVLVEWGIHYIHTLNWLCGGNPQAVFARVHNKTYPEMEGEDTAFVTLEYSSGITSQLNIGYGIVGAPNPPHLMACGNRGTLWQDGGLWLRMHEESADPPELILPESSYDDAVKAGIWHFLDCVYSGDEPIVSGELARKDLEVAIRAYQSSDEKKTVRFS